MIPVSRYVNTICIRACLDGGGGPQVSEVTHLAVVEKWPAFTSKLTSAGSWGDVTGRCCVVVWHVNSENGRQMTHFGGQSALFLSLSALVATFQCCGFFIVTFGALANVT